MWAHPGGSGDAESKRPPPSLLRFPTLYLVNSRRVIDTDRLMERETLRIGEAAHVLGVSEQTLRRWVERGVLHAWRMPITGERRFASAVILKMRAQLEHPVVEASR